MKVGLYGGSFNPIHNGHIALAEAFLRQAELDEVWFMVSPQNPLKANARLLDDKIRFKMVQKVLKHKRNLIACDYEFHLPKPSYTWDTLQRLSNDFPQHQFTLLIGSDNWTAFDRWYHHEDILQNYKIVIYPRLGDEIDKNELPDSVSLLNAEFINISSTEIRERIANGKSIDHLVPAEIAVEVTNAYSHQS
ncbi:nicotinate (nicotinamide) nucleotide adenylyltransferase [Prevotella corporis]|uniref:Probable nicotinate-nucleotide adenylyltransferase n=1 Tax=Prevotella corporis TaxID=28128 RepID=A0A133Q9C6_9BACT|nr:nicotinate (nicotinamide) nucleotide adenylyltransferase [Prevotella corporis]KXA39459.1 nicotinate-nucleotide adenylyltransferase [Prevotella corporis]